MGSGAWSANDFYARTSAKAAAGKDTFDYSAVAKKSGVLRVHQTLDPNGLRLRESRDSAEHPDSNAIIISLDVTGSMDRVVRGIHRDLPHLHELLLGHKYVPHSQIMFAAVGDATCDEAPLQVGQFESDNRMDQNLENMIIEGGGGGGKIESYELAMYVAARHTAIDCYEKRGRKGYLFIIGDEMAYPVVRKQIVNGLFGSAAGLQADLPLDELIAEVRQKYHVFFIIPGGASHGRDADVLDFWHKHLGPQSVIVLERPEDTSACIATTIGLTEGTIHMDEARAQLEKRGGLGGLFDAIRSLFNSTPTGPKPPETSGHRDL
jgi:hypothetical protein